MFPIYPREESENACQKGVFLGKLLKAAKSGVKNSMLDIKKRIRM
jgi:hypothetical protein